MPKKRKAKRKERKTKNRKVEEKGVKDKVKDFFKPTPDRRFWLIIGAVLGPIIAAYSSPILLPMIAPKPELAITVFKSHVRYENGTDVHGVIWNSRYIEYVVMIQQNMSKAESTAIEDVYLVFDFDAAILASYEERIEGVTSPSIKVGGGLLVVGDGEIVTDVRYCELILDLEKLKPEGLCALAVIVDPEYEGSIARLHIVSNPTSRYFGTYHYDALGINVQKSVSGHIP